MDDIESLLVDKPLPENTKEELCRRFERFCWSMAGYICRCPNWQAHGDRDDWFQEAQIALISAGERFDPARGVAFITYATHRVRWMLRNKLRSDNGMIHIPPKSMMSPYTILELLDDVSDKKRCNHESYETVEALLRGLGAVQRDVITGRFGLSKDGRRTLQEIGKAYNKTKEWARLEEAKALANLRCKAVKIGLM